MKTFDEIVTKERLELLRAKREEHRSFAYKEAQNIIGKETVAELKSVYSMFDERLMIWLARLWDPDVGAFYYSNSARDNKGFLPDIESTVQSIRFMESSGLMMSNQSKYDKCLPKAMQEKLIAFARSLQDPNDGFFYHAQWGKNIEVPRRGRDHNWASGLLEDLNAEPLYPTAAQRLSAGVKDSGTPEHLRSVDAFREYLSSFDLATASYRTGNLLQSQAMQIKAAGKPFTDTLFFWLGEHILPNGTWQEKINYDSVNGLMKFMLIYSACDEPFPKPIEALGSAMDAAMLDEPTSFVCQFYNPWVAMNSIISNMYKSGAKERSQELRALIAARGPELLTKTKEKIIAYQKPDGSFSYNRTQSAPFSQGAPVSIPKTNEGDVNATCISSTGMIRNISLMLGIPVVPMYTAEDGKFFFELIENAPSIIKTGVYKPEL